MHNAMDAVTDLPQPEVLDEKAAEIVHEVIQLKLGVSNLMLVDFTDRRHGLKLREKAEQSRVWLARPALDSLANREAHLCFLAVQADKINTVGNVDIMQHELEKYIKEAKQCQRAAIEACRQARQKYQECRKEGSLQAVADYVNAALKEATDAELVAYRYHARETALSRLSGAFERSYARGQVESQPQEPSSANLSRRSSSHSESAHHSARSSDETLQGSPRRHSGEDGVLLPRRRAGLFNVPEQVKVYDPAARLPGTPPPEAFAQ